MLTSPLIRFIGRKSGAHRINRRQRSRLGKGQDQGNPECGSLEQSGQDVRLGGVLPLIILRALLALPLGPRDKGPVRSVRSDCPDPACVLVTKKWRAGNVSLGLQGEKVGYQLATNTAILPGKGSWWCITNKNKWFPALLSQSPRCGRSSER